MKESTPFHISIPLNMTELLKLYARAPDSLLMAGGTHVMRHIIKSGEKQCSILALSQLEELKRISRTERYTELGSCVTINDMINSGQLLTSPLLEAVMLEMGPYPIRNSATIGGNLCVSNKRLDLFPVLQILESQLELRHVKRKKNAKFAHKSRWLHINNFLDAKGRLNLANTEVLTRIRIPFYEGKFYFHKKVNIRDNAFFTINGLATLDKGILADIRIAFSNGGLFITRSRDLEANLLGRRFPMMGKDMNEIMAGLDKYFQALDNPYENHLMRSLFHQLLESLADPVHPWQYLP